MEEKWVKWLFTKNGVGMYYINTIKFVDDNNLFVYLTETNNDKKLVLNWNGTIESYIHSDEAARYKICEHLNLKDGRFYKIENSKYIKWIMEYRSISYNEKKLEHFCIVGVVSVLDIIAYDEPLVSEIE
ncbi:MAG: hypothetical protein LBT51_03125 [Fusobacteriaceae bacterium]|nr:hypothetical protein [Fusobacteriaceae bacterium]